MNYLNNILDYLLLSNQLINYKSYSNFDSNIEVFPKKFTDEDISLNSLLWLKDSKIEELSKISSGHIIISNSQEEYNPSSNFRGSIIVVENPRFSFNKIIGEFFKLTDNLISKDLNQNIGIGTVIEKNVTIGTGVTIGYNNVIRSGTIIGDNVIIGSNNTIGGIGFGYQVNESGEYEIINHIGGVRIDDFVEIGNNNCIDRAVMGYTHLKKNCKIDNLVHIAHGVVIGENSLIIANSMIAGSTKIGNNSWVAPSTSILNDVTFGSNSMSGMGSVIIKDVEDNTLTVGVPAKKIKNI